MNGLLVLDKPAGLTSRDAINRIQGWFPRRTRIGHTGTLDPLATGVLVVCIGTATRLAEYVQAMPKVYRSKFLLGSRSSTDDLDGTLQPIVRATPPTRRALEETLASFVGTIEQVPPQFSAAKVDGNRAYSLARAGAAVSLEPRAVRIDALNILDYTYPSLEVEVHCGRGTYIRSLARDLGQRMGCGGLVAELRRLAVGPFTGTLARGIDVLPDDVEAVLLPASMAVQDLPRVEVTADEATTLRQGRWILRPLRLEAGAEVALFAKLDWLVGIGRFEASEQRIQPLKILG